MAVTNEIATDTLWEEMKSLAVEQQQCFYELLSDCIEYKFDEHKFLQQNIGYAIFGPPKSIENTSTIESDSCYWKPEDLNDTDVDITDKIDYDEKAKNTIDIIYKKILETVETNNTRPIYLGIIYNVIFPPKMNVKSEEKKEVKKEAEKETKTEIKESAKEEEKKNESAISLIPIFQIWENIQKESDTVEQKENARTEIEANNKIICYIDTCGRVYKTWTDYLENNDLPQCTMVLPKGGFYQADKSYPATKDYSTVWLEVIDSPACAWTARICNGIDVASNIVTYCTVGLSVASMFTPLAPVTLTTGLVATGVSSIWQIGRSSQQLVDRKNHEESIHVLNKGALPHWLGIAGTTFGLGALGGSAALSRTVASGKTVPNLAKAAFNTIQGGNILLNGAGIIYQGYFMIDKYMTDKTVSYGDTLNFAIHIMFFTGAVVNIQFANDIIKSTQGKVISDYKDSLRKKNLRKKFNRVMRKAAENNTCKIAENADVIKYIKNRELIVSANQPASGNQSVARKQTLDNAQRNIVWSMEQGKLKVNGIILLDPIEYVICLINSGIFNENHPNNPSSSKNNNVDDSIIDQLKKVFSELLTKFYTSDDCPKSTNLPTIPDFEPLLKDMSSMKIDEECLKKLFKIVAKLMKRSKDKEDFLLMAFTLVWQYCKENLKQWNISSNLRMRSDSGSDILQRIIIFSVSEAISMILDNLCIAFAQYVQANLRR
ncbi:uncharacterized protein [Anoplolepis gracilipes]|uniref:uncharacterized protein n=1 Tax=Anoplolepis gracilipes TaxID=354296 RepID=UPI003BA3CBC6